MARLHYDLDDDDQLMVLNPDAVESCYQYPDLTAQVDYLASAVEGALSQELEPELNFLTDYDVARRAMRSVLALPDRKRDKLITLLH